MSCDIHYCAFWFPTIYHTAFAYRKRTSCTEPISITDSQEDILFFQVSLNEKTFDLNFKIGKNVDTKSNTIANEEDALTLTKVSKSNNGFIVYSYNLSETKTDFFKSFSHLNICYHHAKSLFHVHEKHGSGDYCLVSMFWDSSYRIANLIDQDYGMKNLDYAGVLGWQEGLKKNDFINIHDNPVIQYYLAQYESMFKYHAQYLSETYGQYKNLELDIEKSKGNKKLLWNQWRAMHIALNDSHIFYNKMLDCLYFCLPLFLINNINGRLFSKMQLHTMEVIRDASIKASVDYVYCKTLLESKHNTAIKYNTGVEDKPVNERDNNYYKSDMLRKMAVNIRSSVRYIEYIKYCVMELESHYVEVRFSKARTLALCGIGIALLSLFLKMFF